MTKELKPCPAGHDAEIAQQPDGITYSPKCADWNCAWKIDEEFSDPETATKFWNTRAESDEVARMRGMIAELLDTFRWTLAWTDPHTVSVHERIEAAMKSALA